MKMRRTLLAALTLLACGAGISMHATADSAGPAPTWVIAPAEPGDNLPPVGRSLFDQLFAVTRQGKTTLELPFPFEALLARLDATLTRDPNSTQPAAKRVLIPLGRSLQRTAAAPDYFAYPRVVLAVDGESAAISEPYLKDRLYLGYQEKSAVLEVISYNEAAGRFEFQLVKDYRAGAQPQVFYANRTLCFACHQNGSPIFSRALWDETNANPHISAQLAATGRDFYGILPERGVDIPYAIDNATERANGFALTQRLWREGCGENDSPARRCRAGLYSAALRHALSGGQRWEPDANFRQSVTDHLLPEARRRWPGGLAIGNPDLPNRNPLAKLSDWPAESAARVALSDVAAQFDPLAPRPPREIWQPDNAVALARVIAGLSEFVSAADRQSLESALARKTDMATSQQAFPCKIASNPAGSRWSVRCGDSLEADLAIKGGRPTSGQLNRLKLADGTTLSNVELTPAGTHFTPRLAKRLPRSAAGHTIQRLQFQRRSEPNGGDAILTLREDFAAIEQAVAALLETPQGEKLFGPGAFPRRELLAALLARLGAPAATPCCSAALNLPPPRLEVPAVAPGTSANGPVDHGIQAFFPYCAACHQTAETFPPNFLSGNTAQVTTRLRQCAPRLYVRLAMADLPAEQRAKTPMPPESLLAAFATDSANWRTSPARKALLAQVGDWLRAESGRPPNLNELLASGYEALRPCLPAP